MRTGRDVRGVYRQNSSDVWFSCRALANDIFIFFFFNFISILISVYELNKAMTLNDMRIYVCLT